MVTNGKPWLLLVPNYVYMKDYYKPALASAAHRVLYLTPPGVSLCLHPLSFECKFAEGAKAKEVARVE